ncbi:MAG: hypothetical protein ACM32F_05880 [Betaproteobacteria bacterium]
MSTVFPIMTAAAPCRACRAVTLAAALLLAIAAGGCAVHTAPKATGAKVREVPEATSRAVFATWQARLEQYIAQSGDGDPAVLSQLPALRSPAVVRPAQIVFAASDIEAHVAERDGYDAFGLLLGRQNTAAGPRYVFIVGAIQREDYWPVALADVRVVALSVKAGIATWETGPADLDALLRYRKSADTSTALRFPAERDQFRLVDCEPGICVEELRSGARWVLYGRAPSVPATSSVPSASAAR